MRHAAPAPPRVTRCSLTPPARPRCPSAATTATWRSRRTAPARLRRQQRHATLRPRARRPGAGGGLHRRACASRSSPRRPVDRLRGRHRGVEEGGDDRRAGGHAGVPRRRAARRHLGTGRHDHSRRPGPSDRPAAGGGRGRAADGADAARPRAGRSRPLWPERLPGGRAVLFTITALTGGLDAAQVAVLDLQTGTHGARARRQPRPLRVEWPHRDSARLGTRAGTLRAVPFDLARLETRGTPVPVVPHVVTTRERRRGRRGGGRRHAGVRVGRRWRASRSARSCGWTGRAGDADSGAAARVRLSPAVTRRHPRRGLSADQEQDLWLWDLARSHADPSHLRRRVSMLTRVDARRPPADLQLGAGGRAESLLAGGRTAPARSSG